MDVELGRADSVHDNVEDTELAGGERADHDATRGQALGAQLPHARLGRDVAEARDHAAGAAGASRGVAAQYVAFVKAKI